MTTKTITNSTTARAGEQAAVSSSTVIFLGIDVAKQLQTVVRFVPGEGVKPAEKITAATLVKRVAKWRKAGYTVHCVYEAGPTGFGLARQLIALGATCLVVRPKRLERYGRRRKTDPMDAQHLAEDLAAHHFGRKGLLCPVRQPSVEEELLRLSGRQRDTLSRVRHKILNSAKSRALALGYDLPKKWWGPRNRVRILPDLPPALATLLERAALAAAALLTQLEAIETELIARAAPAPVGVGAVTTAIVDAEVCSWPRFKNHRQVGSFAGLCPSENSSGERHEQGSIDKHGSGRLRFYLQEAAWRLLRFQPDYQGCLWVRQRMLAANKTRIKQLMVGLTRRFLIDWWRVRIGKARWEELGMIMRKAA